ncbi:MAG: PIG-L family deacetylase [Kordiimonadaceae bacterium]|nr:PIG-L family deacetylase [Kordiimonadaceae bacterium]
MKVLVVAPHPDDETLGCGGSLLRHKAKGDSVEWLIMTMKAESHGFDKACVESREREIRAVAAGYGFDAVHNLALEPAGLDKMPLKDLVAKVGAIVKAVAPDILYLPFGGDAHTDHAICFVACFPCTKIFRYPSVQSVRIYETLSETEFGDPCQRGAFAPNLYIGIEEFLEEKLAILALYEGEMQEAPFPRNAQAVRAQALLRGQVAGTTAAEAFMIFREIEA